MHKKTQILSTKALDSRWHEWCKEHRISLSETPMIRIEDVLLTHEEVEAIKSFKADAWAITSQNAVPPLMELIGEVSVPERLYAVGETSATWLNQRGYMPILPDEKTSAGLALKIIEDSSIRKVVFFKGNLALGTLPLLLRENDIDVLEVEVYRTRLTPAKIPTDAFDGVLFFSPSGVRSFLMVNKIEIPCFAIGPTTAETLIASTDAPVLMPEQQGIEHLLEFVADHFKVTD